MDAVIIGYSGHAYVVIDVIRTCNYQCIGYCEIRPKESDPYKLKYFGFEEDEHTMQALKGINLFLGIGDNNIRAKVFRTLVSKGFSFPRAIHSSAVVSEYGQISNGTLVMPGCVINSLSVIGEGVICNTSSVIEHECEIGDFAHIAPGAVLAGNVKVGSGAFVGANAVVRQGICIGDNAIIGAGSVVVSDVPAGAMVYGNPARMMKSTSLR